MVRGSRLFAPDYDVGSQSELEELLEAGTVKVGLAIPWGFGADLLGGRGARVQVLLDGSETLTALFARSYIEAASTTLTAQLLGAGSAGRDLALVDTRSRVWFNEDLRKQDFNVPAEMAAVVGWLSTLLPAVAIVREREQGTLEQLFVTPIRSIELIVGKGVLAAVIAYLGFLEALALAILHVRVPLQGSLGLLMTLGVFYIFVEMGLGLTVSAMVRTQGQAFVVTFFWMMLESILSGQILPVENMPRAVQTVSRLMPSTHFTVIVRSIMLRGSTLLDLWPQVLALAALGAGLYALAATRLRKRLD
jgi:ABC-2 type transport system permease protein